jgi:hypothetical protein
MSITLFDNDILIFRGPFCKMFTMYFKRFTEENRKNSEKVFCENIKMTTQTVPKFLQKKRLGNIDGNFRIMRISRTVESYL